MPRTVCYSDLGGIDAVLHDITELIEYPLAYPEARAAICAATQALASKAMPSSPCHPLALPAAHRSPPQVCAGFSTAMTSCVRHRENCLYVCVTA